MADADSSQGEGQILTTVLPMQRLVVCDPLQIVALKTKVCGLHSLKLCQRKDCPGSRSFAAVVQRFLLAARYKIWILHFTAVLFCHEP